MLEHGDNYIFPAMNSCLFELRFPIFKQFHVEFPYFYLLGKMLTDTSSKKVAASSYRRPFGCAGECLTFKGGTVMGYIRLVYSCIILIIFQVYGLLIIIIRIINY